MRQSLIRVTLKAYGLILTIPSPFIQSIRKSQLIWWASEKQLTMKLQINYLVIIFMGMDETLFGFGLKQTYLVVNRIGFRRGNEINQFEAIYIMRREKIGFETTSIPWRTYLFVRLQVHTNTLLETKTEMLKEKCRFELMLPVSVQSKSNLSTHRTLDSNFLTILMFENYYVLFFPCILNLIIYKWIWLGTANEYILGFL